MKKVYYLITFLLIFLTACEEDLHYNKDQEDKDDNFIGQMCSLQFDIPLEGFEERDAVLYISAPDGSVITRRCSHSRENGISNILLEKGLKNGTYRLLYFEFKLPKPLNNGRITKRHFGLGCRITVEGLNFIIEDSYDRDMELYGKGTEEEPYVIASDYDLRTMAKKVNDSRYNEKIDRSVYFKQYADTIDLSDISFDCDNIQGWSPIGTNNTVPFRANFNGDNKIIKGLNIKRYDDNGVGLFGFTVGAWIKNVRIQNSEIRGNVAVGALIGSISTAGGETSCTVVDSCKLEKGVHVIGTEDKGGLATGGLIGHIDYMAKATINNCSTDKEASVSSCYNAGGIVGTSSLYSAVILSNCTNNASVTSQYSGCGGIIAGGDTIIMTSCKNYGTITGSTLYTGQDDTAGIGTGGLIGGSGMSTIASCINYGEVTGKDGVGGIIGSTRITGSDTEAYVYNTTMVLHSGNEGNVSGNIAVGGICGEAQFGSFGVYNTGNINGGDYTAGIVGTTSIGVVHNSINTGNINGGKYTAGIVGKTNFGSFAIDHNYGTVTGSGSHAGGILGLGSNNTMINYCGNHGAVTAGGDGPAGGIIAEIGDPSDWTAMNTVNCILGSAEMIMGIIGPCIAYYEYKVGEVSKAILRVEKGVEASCMLIDTAFLIWDLVEIFPRERAERLKLAITDATIADAEAIKATVKSLRSSYGNFTVNPFYSNAFSIDYINNTEALVDYYSASDENADAFNYNINEARYERADKLEKFSFAMDIIHATIAGVCIIGGAIAAIGGAFVSGGTSVALYLSVVGGVSSVVGGANTIWKTCTDFEENAVIISQCVNTGYIQSTNNSSKQVGGLVGKLHDYSIIRDCLNSGSGNNAKGGGHFAGVTKVRTQVLNSLTIANIYGWYDIFEDTPPLGSYTVDNLYYCSNSDNQTSVPTITMSPQRKPSTYAKGLTNDQVEDESSYSGWDFDKRWTIPDANGAFPIPFKSEYQTIQETE